ncbi:hypothetical protein Clacol_006552 [Clathrus columnatus]|uniref:Vacuolar calcium ion transporter n=1 Tax=Clathrus columnatus TaxID=1419009 RepID=A0AAV5AH69_9AGAM|nr:hypothetical protein Clacol_006552 [Clathrus columnatus]
MAEERTPLLSNANGYHPTFTQRVANFLKPEGQPGFIKSYKNLFFSSYFNLLLIFIPLAGVAHFASWDAAIIPLAKLIGESTDAMSNELGQTLSGLLNASFGNAIEIIVGIAALLKDEIRIVQTSLLGSILGNILLVLGSSFLAGGIYGHQAEFRTRAAQTYASLLTLGCITLVIPAAYRSASLSSNDPLAKLSTYSDKANNGLLTISRGTAILLLIVYVTYLSFQLRTHHDLFTPRPNQGSDQVEDAHMNTFAAGSALLLVTLVTAFVADWLVDSIEETAELYHISKPFIGMILIPIVANAAEHTTSIWMAIENKYELTMGICVGSSIQIALFVVPLLVLFRSRTYTVFLRFRDDHPVCIGYPGQPSNHVRVPHIYSQYPSKKSIRDGRSNYMEGVMLITLYLVIALTFWVS